MSILANFSRDQIDVIVAFCAAISALAALASVFFAYRTIRASSRQKETEIFLVFQRRYNDPEMKEALRSLATVYVNDKEFFEKWIIKLASGEKEAELLDKYRRIIKGYFLDVALLYDHGYITKSLAESLLNVGGLNIFNKVVRPMEMKVNPNSWPKKDFDKVTVIRKMYGYGEIFRPKGTG